jgi:hypothetical protein
MTSHLRDQDRADWQSRARSRRTAARCMHCPCWDRYVPRPTPPSRVLRHLWTLQNNVQLRVSVHLKFEGSFGSINSAALTARTLPIPASSMYEPTEQRRSAMQIDTRQS